MVMRTKHSLKFQQLLHKAPLRMIASSRSALSLKAADTRHAFISGTVSAPAYTQQQRL